MTEILLKVALNTINQTEPNQPMINFLHLSIDAVRAFRFMSKAKYNQQNLPVCWWVSSVIQFRAPSKWCSWKKKLKIPKG